MVLRRAGTAMFESHVTKALVDERMAAVEAGAIGEGVMCAVGRADECRWDRCVHGRVVDGAWVPHWRPQIARRMSFREWLACEWARLRD